MNLITKKATLFPKTSYLPLLITFTLCLASGYAFAQENPDPDAVFLKAFYSLDEPRFHCVDIPGHKDRVNVGRPLSVHTCKEGIWHKDELFDYRGMDDGQLLMHEYDLCIEASEIQDGAALLLKPCELSALQVWEHDNYRLRLKAYPDRCLTIGAEASELTQGGRRLPSRHMSRSLNSSKCADDIFERQMWRFEKPQERSGSVMPFAD